MLGGKLVPPHRAHLISAHRLVGKTSLCEGGKTQKVVAVRPLGKKGNVILVTFQGKTCPKRVSYMHEVLAVLVSTRVKFGDTPINIHNTYIRPCGDSNEVNWIKGLVEKNKHTILAGDFNTRHTAWGYPNKNARGKHIKKACLAAGLHLCNDPATPTRLAQAANQNDRSIDLTWASPRLQVQWQVQTDPWGSDHLPIHIKLPISTSPRRRVTFTKWDSFRTAMSRLANVPFADRIQQALRESRTEYNVKEDTPPPNLHLIKLWDRRLEALQRYRARRSLRNKIRLNCSTAKAKKYTIELRRTIWRSLCDSFNERTGYRKLWQAYKGLAGKTKMCNTGSNLALRLGITEEQLAEEAGDCFFPQQPEPPAAEVYARETIVHEQPAEALFTLAELLDALGGADSQQRYMQSALDVVMTFALRSGLELSKEKTTYMVIPSRRRSARTDIQLRVDGIPIAQNNSVKILGVPFDHKGGAVTWLRKVKSQWKEGLDLLKAISSKAWGAQDDLLRRLVRTLLISKVVYGLNYLRLTKTQETTLITMLRAAMRVVTGLPRFTPVEQLERDRSNEHHPQAQRLSRTPHGQIILASIGRSDLIHGPLMPTLTPPWDAEAVTSIKPLPSYQGPNHPGRRATQVAIHRAEVSKLAAHVDVFYTDAARDNNGRTAIAWHSPTRKETNHKLTECTRSSCMAELRAVLFAVETATNMPRAETTETRIYTDSQEAVRALQQSSTCNVTVARSRELVRQAGARQTITIAWIPGHAGVPGNERADGAARALLQANTQPSQGPVPPPVQRDVPPDEGFDLTQKKKEEQRARKARLAALLPSNPHPIPRGLPRWEQVALHRLQTRTMMTPFWRAKFYKPTDENDTGPDPGCPHCGVPATCYHLVWSCAGASLERMAAINTLPPHLKPMTLREWKHPRTSAPAERDLIFLSIIYLRSSGTGRYV
ncbi:hypothetical protein HPB47_021917 [Ixodes persulcatus]|uniref:Uncharacterized protein n=1 Tax=Ixodes persulcatus TaxID=34615 RepID=A0AC60QB76_IXOPE|nr:hypothetical protein HPB47_021917 [Ixodes persulcatus]